jgi:hypothetical protein
VWMMYFALVMLLLLFARSISFGATMKVLDQFIMISILGVVSGFFGSFTIGECIQIVRMAHYEKTKARLEEKLKSLELRLTAKLAGKAAGAD